VALVVSVATVPEVPPVSPAVVPVESHVVPEAPSPPVVDPFPPVLPATPPELPSPWDPLLHSSIVGSHTSHSPSRQVSPSAQSEVMEHGPSPIDPVEVVEPCSWSNPVVPES
jgi:hypothetical protein